MINKFYNIEKTNDTNAEVSILGRIGSSFFEHGVEFEDFKHEVDSLGDVRNIKVNIGSEGGNVDMGLAIYNYLRQHQATIHTNVISQASSIASVIFLAGEKRTMMVGTTAYIHEPLTGVEGYADDLFQMANYLETTRENIIDIYQERTGQSRESLAKLMKEETLMNVSEAMRRGFVTEDMSASDVVNQSVLQYTHMTNEVVNINKLALEEAEEIMSDKTEIELLKEQIAGLTGQIEALKVDNSQEASEAAQVATDAAHEEAPAEEAPAEVAEEEAEVVAEVVAEEALTEEAKAEIKSICAASKIPNVAAYYIDANVSVEQVREDLFAMVTTGDTEIQNGAPLDRVENKEAEIKSSWNTAFKNVK